MYTESPIISIIQLRRIILQVEIGLERRLVFHQHPRVFREQFPDGLRCIIGQFHLHRYRSFPEHGVQGAQHPGVCFVHLYFTVFAPCVKYLRAQGIDAGGFFR